MRRDANELARIARLQAQNRKEAWTARAEQERKSGPIVVPADVLEGLEAVRQSEAHMVERAHVLVLDKRMSYRQTDRWVEEHPNEYACGLSHGFEVSG